MRKASAAWMSAVLRTRSALITLQPVRRAASWQNDGPSSPCSWSIVSCSSSTAVASSGRVGLTNTPTISAWRRSSELISSAVAGSQRRGLCGEWLRPIAQAPRRTASRASSTRRDAAELDPHRDTMVEPPGPPGRGVALGPMGDRAAAPPAVADATLEAEVQRIGRELADAFPAPARHPVRSLDKRAMQLTTEDARLGRGDLPARRRHPGLPLARRPRRASRRLPRATSPSARRSLEVAMKMAGNAAGRKALGAATAAGVRHMAHRFIVGESPQRGARHDRRPVAERDRDARSTCSARRP